MAENVFGAVELGGTKTFVVIAEDKKNIISRHLFPTLSPKDTMENIATFFKNKSVELKLNIQKLGVGCFGPLDLNKDSALYGSITSTPKKGWEYFNIKRQLENALNVPVKIDTDVNASALGEYNHVYNSNINNFAYITIGTGIGGGFIINRQLVHGLVHPEFGHIRIPHNKKKDPFPGICPYHQDCLEGLASGPAITERWHQPSNSIPKDHVAWKLEAEYLSHAITNLICTISPELIVLGGGVMHQYQLFGLIHTKTKMVLNQYIKSKFIQEHIEEYIIPPRLHDDSGIMGALILAMQNTD